MDCILRIGQIVESIQTFTKFKIVFFDQTYASFIVITPLNKFSDEYIGHYSYHPGIFFETFNLKK